MDGSLAIGIWRLAVVGCFAAGLDYRPFFSDVESVFLNHNGRPHWGKIHSLGAKELGELYPKWESFQKARRELDPEGRFLSPYIVRLLGS